MRFLLRSICAGRHSAFSFEYAVKAIDIIHPNLSGNMRNGIIGRPEQMLCLTDPMVDQVVHRCCLDGHMEAAKGFAFADACGGGNIRKTDGLCGMLRDELQHCPGPGGQKGLLFRTSALKGLCVSVKERLPEGKYGNLNPEPIRNTLRRRTENAVEER